MNEDRSAKIAVQLNGLYDEYLADLCQEFNSQCIANPSTLGVGIYSKPRVRIEDATVGKQSIIQLLELRSPVREIDETRYTRILFRFAIAGEEVMNFLGNPNYLKAYVGLRVKKVGREVRRHFEFQSGDLFVGPGLTVGILGGDGKRSAFMALQNPYTGKDVCPVELLIHFEGTVDKV